MLENKKHVFWEALLMTIVVFILGMLIGVSFEANKLEEINTYYAKSEISLMDALALGNVDNLENVDCGILVDTNIDFADRIYEEAYLLEKYEDAGKVTETLKLAHKKYDLLRTFLWINSIKISDKCGDYFSFVVYLYEYEPDDLTQKAVQDVWSKILFDLKQEKGNKMILIPIAIDSDLTSLNSLIGKFDIGAYPVVIVDNKYVFRELHSVDEFDAYIK